METAYFSRLYAYTEWANRRMWEAGMPALSEAQFTQPAAPGDSSLLEQCVHVMGVEYWWLHFLRTGELDFIDDAADYPDRAAVWARWQQVMRTNRAFVEGLTPADLQRKVHPEFWPEEEQPIFLWEALVQVANHSTDHRAHIMVELDMLGAPTVEQDFLTFILEEQLQGR